MLRLRALVPTPEHEEVFIQRYQWLRGQALQLTRHDAQRAEDLVHDVFIQFMLSRPDLRQIHNLEGYLYRMLRNLHLSSVRRASLVQHSPLSILDYDSAEIGLRTVDLQARLQAQEDLRRICHYACVRRATSKVGSVLILRFFHGYYPGEIAQILRVHRRAVEAALHAARREARLYLDDPHRLRLMAEHQPTRLVGDQPTRLVGGNGGPAAGASLRELRESIFRSCSSACLPGAQLRRLYRTAEPEAIDCATLDHLVSCPQCLDEVNRLLGLATLAERSPEDTIGKDPGPKSGSGGSPPDGASGSSSADEFKRKSRRRLRDVLEHRPQELLVSVNGFILGSQRVGLERNEQTISINLPEQVGFVEVFSEQGLRLSFLDVEPPTDGAIEQRTRAEFSDGRALELALDFGGPWPTLRVVYHDPTLKAAWSPEPEVQSPTSKAGSPDQGRHLWMQIRERWHDSGLRRLNFRLWLRPGAVTVLVSLLVIAALLLARLTPAPILAAELLRRSTAAEEAAARPDQVTYRTIHLEERALFDRNADGKPPSTRHLPPVTSHQEVIARWKIEVWQSVEKGTTALRVYNEQNQLIAGEWTGANGSRTIYQRGARPQSLGPVAESQRPVKAPLAFDEVWQLELSAKGFAALVGNADQARVEEHATTYQINYEKRQSESTPGLLKATLVLGKSDLHPIEQMLLVRGEDASPQSGGWQLREFRFWETSYERRPIRAVAPAVFEPEPQLIRIDTKTRREGDTEKVAALPSLPFSPSQIVATTELEIEVLRLLHQARADLGEQLSVARRREGELRVEGIVETDERKQEILRALSSVMSNPAVKVEVSTVAEALKQQSSSKATANPVPFAAATSSAAIAQQVGPTGNAIPVEADLRRHFSEEEARRFADRIVDRSHQAMRHAWALKRLLNQFSPEDLRTLNPEGRAKWLALLRAHARAFEQHTRALRLELQPVFFPGTPFAEPPDAEEIKDDEALARAVGSLFDLGSANDQVVRAALAISTESGSPSAIKSQQFWRALRSAEKLAAKIASD